MTSQPPDGPPPAMHPMDPRGGRDLSPMFAAFLGWLLALEPMTSPAITGIAVSGNAVLAATDQTRCSTSIWGRLRISRRTSAAGAKPAAPMPAWWKASSPA